MFAKYFRSKEHNNDPWAKKSYSQSGEDLIVKFIFDNIGIKKPSYIDIGAHHPFYLSNTALFYSLGSRGINIEPDPVLFNEFLNHRKQDINLNYGISEKEGNQDFFLINEPALNTFSKSEAENYIKEGQYFIKETVKVKVFEIQQVISKYSNGKFPDFLSLDAEGIDELVLKSIDYNKSSPLVICVETITFSTSGNGVKNQELINYIESKDYLLYADTNINSIFVKKEMWIR